MKNNKLQLNFLFARYLKGLRKLKSLVSRGINFHKQNILFKRIKKIEQQIFGSNYAINKSKIISVAAGIGFSVFSKDLIAQNFQPSVVNPFDLTIVSDGFNTITSADYKDMDADGDIDALVYSKSLNEIYLVTNEGTANVPEFGAPLLIIDSLANLVELYKISLGDLDNDGDFDLIAGNNDGDFIYFENLGTPYLLNFDTYSINPFALSNISSFLYLNYSDGLNFPSLIDIDEDGDLDIFTIGSVTFTTYYYGEYEVTEYENLYLENIGNNETPIFAEGPNIDFITYYYSEYISTNFAFGDLDGDNDIDAISGLSNNFSFSENTGLINELPEFNEIKNPFGINTVAVISLFSPSMVDLDNDNDLDLMLLKLPNDFYYFENKICDSVSTNIIENNFVLTAEQQGVQYQWFSVSYSTDSSIYFPTLLPNDTNQSYTPTVSGSYLVQINTGNCTFNSAPFYNYKTCENMLQFYYVDQFYNQLEILNVFDYYGETPFEDIQFQWLDCDNNYLPIAGETNEAFEPGISGNFAVQLITDNCSDTIACTNFNFCDTILINITLGINSLSTALIEDAGYAWYNCSNNYPLSNENSNVFFPQATGEYYVKVGKNGCTYQSECAYINVCEGVSGEIVFENNILTALQDTNTTYQWVDCNEIGSFDYVLYGETGQSYTPVVSGSYAVEIHSFNCYFTSDCIDVTISKIDNYENENNYLLNPNPSAGKFQLTTETALRNAVFQLKSISGQNIFTSKNRVGSNFVFDFTNIPNGLYILEISENGMRTWLKVLKE